MPTWIECRECGIEFRDKPGRVKCPECGSRIEEEDDEQIDRPRRKSKTKAKPKSRAVLFSLIGVGVLAVGLVVVVVLLLVGGGRADPTKVTVANFKKLSSGMTQADAEKILAGSSSSSLRDLQNELARAYGTVQAQFDTMFTLFNGPGTWRRWDGVNSDLIVWGLFSSSVAGRKEPLTHAIALERLPGGGYQKHILGGQLNGFPFPPMPNIQMPQIQFPNVQMPQMPPPQFPGFPK